MANYHGRSHYTHEVNQEYKDGWNAIFGNKKNPGAVNVKVYTKHTKSKAGEKGTGTSSKTR